MLVDFNQLPEWLDQPVAECIALASKEFSVPPLAITLVMAAEGGRVGSVRKNKNGSVDMGPMQVNTIFSQVLGKYGITNHMVTNDLCVNIRVGTWHLKSEMNRVHGDLWKGIGNYHSRTPSFNKKYVIKVKTILYNWAHGGYVNSVNEAKEDYGSTTGTTGQFS